MLAVALRLHWLCAYLFILNGLVFVIGLAIGGGWPSLLPRRTDSRHALKKFRYYLGVPVAKLTHRSWLSPRFDTKYNALQRIAYFSIPVAGLLSIFTGWAIHKPMQLYWLTWIFGGYDNARIWHFWLMWFFVLFAVPHVVLVLADGWDTFRSMITGWSRQRDKAMTSGTRSEQSMRVRSESFPSTIGVFGNNRFRQDHLRDRNLTKAGYDAARQLSRQQEVKSCRSLWN
jgi:thiosulfate reductase cytochrome b subunit